MNMWHDLARAFTLIDSDKTIRVAILTGGPKTFSTGMDLSVFAEMQQVMSKVKCEGRRREAMGNLIQFLQDVVSAPERCHVPGI
jgi:enoyl-CoA hydratase